MCFVGTIRKIAYLKSLAICSITVEQRAALLIALAKNWASDRTVSSCRRHLQQYAHPSIVCVELFVREIHLVNAGYQSEPGLTSCQGEPAS